MGKSQKFYEPEVLKKLQKIEIAMLKDFVKICEENDIDYFLAYGAALGAMRHKGFIPWDDDIDICMLRKDYERFAKIVSEGEYNERYEMISAANSDDYLMPEAHWQLRGTKFVDAPSLDYKAPLGIFLDLFILDNLADDPKERKKQERDCFIWGKILIVRALAHPIVPYGGIVGGILKAGLWLFHYFMVLFHISPRWLYRKYTEAATRFNDVKTEYVTDFRSTEMDDVKLTMQDIYPLRKVQFEDVEVNVNHNCEQSLTNLYGDYMQIPPVEKQHNHLPEILDFGTAYEDFHLTD